MEIGGHDVILTVPADVDAARVAVCCATSIWPASIVVDDADGSVQLANHFASKPSRERQEYFIFQTPGAFESWKVDGPTDANAAEMLHFISRPIAGQSSQCEVTLVHYSESPSIIGLVEDVTAALTPRTASTSG